MNIDETIGHKGMKFSELKNQIERYPALSQANDLAIETSLRSGRISEDERANLIALRNRLLGKPGFYWYFKSKYADKHKAL